MKISKAEKPFRKQDPESEISDSVTAAVSLTPASGVTSIVPAASRKVRLVAPYSRHLNCRIRSCDHNREIHSFLFDRFPFRSRKEWAQRLSDGWITQGNSTLSAGDRIQSQPSLTLYHPEHSEPSVPDEVQILQSNHDFLLAYKPAPMPVYPGGRYNRNTLTTILQEKEHLVSTNHNNHQKKGVSEVMTTVSKDGKSDLSALHMIHRLDSVTSGLVLLGRTPDFSRTVSQDLSDGKVEKFYLALVSGTPADQQCTIDTPIRRKSGFIFECSPEGKPSITDFQVLERTDTTSLILCRPRTGRTHQIRLHLREWGYPVIDDNVYGQADGPDLQLIATPSASDPDYRKIIPMQNRAISLLHCRMHIPSIGMDFRLPDSLIQAFFNEHDPCLDGNPVFPMAAKEYLAGK